MSSNRLIVQWNKDLETGIEIVDEQHKTFLIKSNQFFIRIKMGDISSAAEELDFLENYLLTHFQAEETFQFTSKYPKYKIHQAEHKRLSFQVKELSFKLKAFDYSEETIAEFCAFINEWIAKHILEDDLEFSRYYKEASASLKTPL